LAEVHHLPDQRRELISDANPSALRATWHNEAGYVVLSLWRGNLCVATSQLTPKEAGRLATFIIGGLANLAEDPPRRPAGQGGRRLIREVHSTVASLRLSLGGSLERLGRRLRTSR